MTALLFAMSLALTTPGRVPTNVAMPQSALTATLTSIVVADIDRDGDVDVVATDDALHLFVWINDGAGHLTQQRPAPPGSRSVDARGADIGGRAPRSDASVPTDPPAFDAHVGSTADAPLAWTRVTRFGADGHVDSVGATERLRGPPAASPLR